MQAIVRARDAGLPVEIVAVISNRADAPGLGLAAAAGIPVFTVAHTDYTSRADFDAALSAAIDPLRPDLVVLAGFMRVLGADLVGRYGGRMVNIHPSLLPAFPGLHTHARALAAGCKVHGATVHFVTPELDHGPILAQAVVPVRPGDDAETLAARVLKLEHLIYPRAIGWIARGLVKMDGDRVRLSDASLEQWVFE
ncbi:MAG: phosphoribosylglycinamide formyltransferase [Burkholderiales bacterium]|nr:phosphoribosylglycinamide formyltransferase [Burkholderiales bacterium]